MTNLIKEVTSWANENDGFLTLILFFLSLFLGWLLGLFRLIRHRPVFRISTVEGPTFCSTFPTGRTYEGQPTHRTGIALYLKIANVGNAAASIENLEIGYRMPFRTFTSLWFSKALRRHWLRHPTTSLGDFRIAIGENIKVYPSLIQHTFLTGTSPMTYLEVGRTVNGVVYFEQEESWGGFFPLARNGILVAKLRVIDSFRGVHCSTVRIPVASLEEARRFLPEFGDSFEALRRQSENGGQAAT